MRKSFMLVLMMALLSLSAWAAAPNLSGSGTSADPYLIYSKADLQSLSASLTSGWSSVGKYFKVMNDIEGVTSRIGGTTSATAFRGVFDGNGKTITINLNGTNYVALFSMVGQSGCIHDLTVDGEVYGSSMYAAGIVGYVNANYSSVGEIRIYNCVNKAKVTCTANYAGGVVGRIVGNTSSSSSFTTAYVTNCLNKGSVSGNGWYHSGIVGACGARGIVDGCENRGTIAGTLYTGGCVGSIDDYRGTVKNCANKGTINAQRYCGGVIGGVGTGYTIYNCYNVGTVNATESPVGGVIGRLYANSSKPGICHNIYNGGSFGTLVNTTLCGSVVGERAGSAGNVSSNWFYLAGTAPQPYGSASVTTNLTNVQSFTQDGTTCTLQNGQALINVLNAYAGTTYQNFVEDIYGNNHGMPAFSVGQPAGLEITPSSLSMGYRPIGAWMPSSRLVLHNPGSSAISVTNLDFDNNFFMLNDQIDMPFTINGDEDYNLYINTNPELTEQEPGEVGDYLAAVWENGRDIELAEVNAIAYTPICPDVWELAQTVNSYPYTNTPSGMYNNYQLPGDTPDGFDAVYKMTFENDMLLNADVTSGANGKMAIYTEDFNGYGGPHNNNNYTGPVIYPGLGTLGGWLYYDQGSHYISEGYHQTMIFNWGIKFEAGDLTNFEGTSLTKIKIFDGEVATIQIRIYEGGNRAPETLIGTQTVQTTWAEEWVDVTLDTPIPIDNSKSLWITCRCDNAEYPASGCHFTGVNNGTWFSLDDGESWNNLGETGGLVCTWMLRGFATNIRGEVAELGNRDDNLINNMTLNAGTYYLAASSTDESFSVMIDATTIPCPGQSYSPSPADGTHEVATSGTLSWENGEYATEYRVVMGTTYPPTEVVVDWTNHLSDGLAYNDLRNNTLYFWRVDQRNSSCETLGDVWVFTTTLNVPADLTLASQNLYPGDDAQLSWTAIQDRSFREYNVYQDNVLIGQTTDTHYSVSNLAYNMLGYNFQVSAVYDEGESVKSNTVKAYMTGYGTLEGTAFEIDGATPVADATITYLGTDEYEATQTFTCTTDNNGNYSISVLAGKYDGTARKAEYQDTPCLSNPVKIAYNATKTGLNYIMDEVHTPVDWVHAEELDDDNVLVSWGHYLSDIEDFETGDLTTHEWNNAISNYPWEITTTHPYEGNYCIQSGNQNVASSTSAIEVTVEIPRDGMMSFYSMISCESSFDKGYFYIDGTQMGVYTGTSNWSKKEFDITEGTHTFKWAYTKDGSVNSGEDRFFVDYIDFIHDPEPLTPGWHTYCASDFNNAVGSSLTTTPQWGYRYPVSFTSQMAGWMLTKVAIFSDDMYGAVGGNYSCTVYVGGDTPDAGTAVSSITVDVPANQNAWLEYSLTAPVNISGTENVWVIWKANTSVSSWPAGCCGDIDPSNDGTWWEGGSGWEHLTYGDWTIKNYFTDRSGRSFGIGCTADLVNTPINMNASAPIIQGEGRSAIVRNPNATVNTTVETKGGHRAFASYKVWRTSCYNMQPDSLNAELIAFDITDTMYVDVAWAYLEPGTYKWGVSCVYEGNHVRYETPISWGETPTVVNHDNVETVSARFNESNNNVPRRTKRHGSISNQPDTQAAKAAFRGTPAYLSNLNNPTIMPYGINKIDLNEPTIYEHLANRDMYAGEVIDGLLYGCDGDSYFYIIDAASGEILYEDETATYCEDYAYDYTTGTMYGVSGCYLYTIDLTDGSGTVVGYMEDVEGMVALMCDNDGVLYGIEYDSGCLYIIDKEDASVEWITCTGTCPTYLQSATIDHNTGICYWAYTDDDCDDLLILDLETGDTEFVCNYVECGMLTIAVEEPVIINHESIIVASNCLDKSMTTTVDVTVSLNSHESPAGATVILTNVGVEYGLGYDYSVELDETGYYAWDEFRKGEYTVRITLPYYSSDCYVGDTLSIWDATSLECVLEELLGNVNDLYVSATGWAMWDGQDPFVPGQGDEWNYDFESSDWSDWTSIDADGDGYNWMLLSDKLGAGYGHNASNDGLMSQSYDNNFGVLYPDNYLVSKLSAITYGSTFSFWACGQDASWAAEHFGVAISTRSNTNPNDFTTIYEHTIGAKGERYDGPRGMREQSTWTQYTVDLSAYAGQSVYIAIRHFNCSDMFFLDVDDIALTIGAKATNSIEFYKVLLNGEFEGNTEHEFFQHNTENLVEGQTYTTSVAAIYTTGSSDFVDFEWVYSSCQNYEGLSNGPEATTTGNDVTISWQLPEGDALAASDQGNELTSDTENSNDAKGNRDGAWMYYDDGTCVNNVGAGGELYWGIMIPASDLTGYSTLSKISLYANENTTGSFDLSVAQGGDNAPQTVVYTESFNPGTTEQFFELTLSQAVSINPEQNLWIVLHNNTADYPASASTDVSGDANGRWVSVDGSSWFDLAQAGVPGYTFMVRAYLEEGGSPVPTGDILGAMLFRDGEWLAFVAAPESSYVDLSAAGEHQYCVRVVYNGNKEDYSYYAMSCEECCNSSASCQAPENLMGQYVWNNNEFGAEISWTFGGSGNPVSFNVYRDDMVVGNVNFDGGTEYSYLDVVDADIYVYQVTAVYDNCESDFALTPDFSANYVIVSVTGLDEGNNARIYPNPTNGNVKIEAVGMNHITVVSALGQVVYDAEVSCDEYSLNMAQFNAGIYMVRISSESGVSTQRVTVVR